jgi:outer membrane protein insertion porin family
VSRARCGALAALLVASALALAGPGAAAPRERPPLVTGVDVASPHRVDEARVRAAIGPLAGRPLDRRAVRESLARLWAQGLWERARVEERPGPGGVRLVFHLERRPHLGALRFAGDLGLERVELAAATRLGPGDLAGPERLEDARRALVDLYRREGYLGARVAVERRVDPATAAVDVTFAVDAGDLARVGRIDVEAADPDVAARVRRSLRLLPGQPFRPGRLRERVRAAERDLREAGRFQAQVSAGEPRVDPTSNTVDLHVTVDAGPPVDVAFVGNRSIDAATLRARLTFTETGTVDEAEVRASARQLAASYRERGHAFAEVTGHLARADDRGVVRFDIEEGPVVTVESVAITGASTVPTGELVAAMQTRPRGLLDKGLFRRDALDRDVAALRALLRDRGWPDAEVGPPQVAFSEDRARARVTVPVVEGGRRTVGDVRIAGAPAQPAAEILAALPLKRGEPWSAARAEEGRRLIERRHARQGHLAAQVDLDTVERDGAVDVTYRVAEGPQTRVGRVIVRGLLLTRDHVVRRELPMKEGDPFNPEDLLEAQARLIRLGLFQRVEVEPLRPPPGPVADVFVTVEEGKPWHVAFGLGYSTFEGFRGFVEAGHDNVFGTGRSLTIRLRASERNERADLVYREPWLLGTRWTGDASLFFEHEDQLGFEVEQVGVSLGAERDLDRWFRGLRTTARYTLSRVDRFNIDPALLEADVTRGIEILSTLTTELTLDRRDRPFDPARGSLHLLSTELGGVALGGDSDFLKWRAETSWFFGWLPPTVVALSARVGLAIPLLNTDSLPIEERFFAGGATTVRGYRERRLGPIDDDGNPTGGNALLVINAEWRFPIWRWLKGAVFFDAGAVSPTVGDLGLDDLRSGIGGGLRLATPVGPVRLDLGYPLDDQPGEHRALRVHLTVGYPF